VLEFDETKAVELFLVAIGNETEGIIEAEL